MGLKEFQLELFLYNATAPVTLRHREGRAAGTLTQKLTYRRLAVDIMVGPYGQVRDMVVYVYVLWSVPHRKKDTNTIFV